MEKPDVFSEGDLGFEKAGKVGLRPNENILGGSEHVFGALVKAKTYSMR